MAAIQFRERSAVLRGDDDRHQASHEGLGKHRAANTDTDDCPAIHAARKKSGWRRLTANEICRHQIENRYRRYEYRIRSDEGSDRQPPKRNIASITGWRFPLHDR